MYPLAGQDAAILYAEAAVGSVLVLWLKNDYYHKLEDCRCRCTSPAPRWNRRVRRD
ncbi:hypothetical protein BD311DRAFT_746023 [Dichomitus squalens]|uniref:Uncharacterized protein n=1 Tax=Dichomitus squalens TaxID=114155 RepID=A0A4Q9N418_9APHY|nr:hypothetical protein BD311DRAFT_746023 [Dichomitus squalens]